MYGTESTLRACLINNVSDKHKYIQFTSKHNKIITQYNYLSACMVLVPPIFFNR